MMKRLRASPGLQFINTSQGRNSQEKSVSDMASKQRRIATPRITYKSESEW